MRAITLALSILLYFSANADFVYQPTTHLCYTDDDLTFEYNGKWLDYPFVATELGSPSAQIDLTSDNGMTAVGFVTSENLDLSLVSFGDYEGTMNVSGYHVSISCMLIE